MLFTVYQFSRAKCSRCLDVCEKTEILHYHNSAVNTILVGDKLFSKKQNFK